MVSRKRPRVMVAGTFEILHPGHLALFRAAARHGDLYVIVSRDANAEKSKGRRPLVPESDRLRMVASLRIVKRAFLGGKDGLLDGVRKVGPDIILLGPDQIPAARLRQLLAEAGLPAIRVLQLKKRLGRWSSSALISTL